MLLSTDVRVAEKKSVEIPVILLSGEVQMSVVQFLHPGAAAIMFEVVLSRGGAPQHATIAGMRSLLHPPECGPSVPHGTEDGRTHSWGDQPLEKKETRQRPSGLPSRREMLAIGSSGNYVSARIAELPAYMFVPHPVYKVGRIVHQ